MKAPTDTSALRDDGRLRGGLDDPNYLAAGIVPSIALAAGLFSGVRSILGRFGLAAACIVLAIGLGATESRGGLIAAFVAILTAVIIAKRGRALVVAFLAIIIGVGCVWFASDPCGVQARDPHGGQGQRAQQPLGGGLADLRSDHPMVGVGLDNYRMYAPRYVDGPGVLNVRELHRRAARTWCTTCTSRRLVEVGLVGLRALPDHHRQLAGGGDARGAKVRAQGGLRVRGAQPARCSWRMIAALVASFFISNGSGFQIWIAAGVRADPAGATPSGPRRPTRPPRGGRSRRAPSFAGSRRCRPEAPGDAADQEHARPPGGAPSRSPVPRAHARRSRATAIPPAV